ncbi:tudor domain-containing protein 7-like [Lethenteron reissneri]|uniref:tudor domain-containing protein 7-like n=1 Tax=Lethenteron reissneri TaxID=7753 RepID=UPI002AB61945|nr:tudor domain-containing protein 7-like [Lethenteron reissneri]
MDRPPSREPSAVALCPAVRSWGGRLTPAAPLVSPWPPAGTPGQRCVDVLVSSAEHPALFAVQAWSQLHRLERLEARMCRHYWSSRGHEWADVAEEAGDEEVEEEEVVVATEPSFVACVQDDRVYRVELKCACPPGKAMVYRVDYGEWDLVPLSTLRPLVPAFTRLPVQAHLAQLADVPRRRWSPELAQVFRKLVEGRPFVALVEEEEGDGAGGGVDGAVGNSAGRAPKLRLSLVDTSHPERDVVIGEVMMGFARS